MSLRLSSLLNPSDEKEAPRSSSSPQETRQPTYSNAQSQAVPHVPSSPTLLEPTPTSYPPNTTHEAAQALAALSVSPVATHAQWHASVHQDPGQTDRRLSNERRPGSGYAESIQLPPLPPQSNATRKMSSPTLEQYQVASRSPEQRRASLVSPTTQSNITLPPLQGFAAPQAQDLDLQTMAVSHELHPTPSSHASAAREPAAQSLFSSLPAVGNAHTAATPPPLLSTAVSSGRLKPDDDRGSSPAVIKQEKMPTPQPLSPSDARRASDVDQQTSKAVSSLKSEHGARTHSPLRESSIPLPSTEVAQPEQPAPTKKRPASAKTKKGTATMMKKAPPAKKRKVEAVRSATPLSHTSKHNGKNASGKGTPANSSPAPSTRSQSADANEDVDDEEDDDDDEMDDDPDADVYCICRRPDNGTFMIGCDGTCDDWFHGKCVGIAERDKNLIDKYICPDCTKAGVGCTTWKRMCRRHGCRQPARVHKTKGSSGSGSSKYCSDECGVLFFRELAGRTRGREEAAKNRSMRRKSGIAYTDTHTGGGGDDLGARGGLLAAGEVKALLNVSKTADDFHRLGDGVLSPPATPDGKENSNAFSAAEEQTLAQIHAQKEDARRRHRLLKDRMKFVTMVKQAALRAATEKEVKPKEHCGYDSRLEWTEEQFERWRESPAGQQAFELETLDATEKDADGMQVDDDEHDEGEICDRKKCARHLEWAKLAVDDLRFEMSDNGDRMRALDKDETALRARAALRVKVGDMAGEGSVEVHNLRAAPPSPVTTTHGQLSVVETVESAEPMAVEAS